MADTKYKTNYCDYVVSYMAQGKSFEAFAGEIGVSRKTLYNWAKEFEAFEEAKGVAFAKRRQYLEDQLDQVIKSDKPMPNLTAFLAKLNNTIWKKRRDKKSETDTPHEDVGKALLDEIKKLRDLT